MKRLAVIPLALVPLALALLAAPLAAEAESAGKVYRIGILRATAQPIDPVQEQASAISSDRRRND